MRKTVTDKGLIVRDLNTGKVIPGVVTADDDTGEYTVVRTTTAYAMGIPYQTPMTDDLGRPVVDKHFGRIRVNRGVITKK